MEKKEEEEQEEDGIICYSCVHIVSSEDEFPCNECAYPDFIHYTRVCPIGHNPA